MTELSGFWTTSGTPSGHQQASYTQAQWSTAIRLLGICSGFEGVAPGYLNNLAGTVTGANTVAINTGAGIVDGKWYINDASLNVNIPSAVGGGNTRIDRIVLRCSWSAFTAVITRIAGTDAASPTAPAITQTPGTTYDIKLYQALVNTSGTVTLTDERTWASNLLSNRQGGSAGDWTVTGATNRPDAGSARIEIGLTYGIIANGQNTVNVAVIFGSSFAFAPICFVTGYYASAIDAYSYSAASITTSGFAINITRPGTSGEVTVRVFWMAIGPR